MFSTEILAYCTFNTSQLCHYNIFIFSVMCKECSAPAVISFSFPFSCFRSCVSGVRRTEAGGEGQDSSVTPHHRYHERCLSCLCHYSYSYGRLTVDTHTHTHAHTHTHTRTHAHTHTHTHTPSQWCRVTSCHCSLHSVKGKSSVPDLRKHTTPWLLIPHGPFFSHIKNWEEKRLLKMMPHVPSEQFIYSECAD